MASSILLKMIKLPEVLDTVNIRSTSGLIEDFRNIRTSSGESSIATSIEFTIQNLRNSFQADYNFGGSGPYTLSIETQDSTGDTLRIKLNIEDFFDASEFVETTSAGNNFVATFVNEPVPIGLSVSSVGFSQASSDFCTKIDASITTSEQIDDYSIDGGANYVSVSTNPFTISNLARIVNTSLKIRKGSDVFNYTIKVPSILLKANISATYTNSPSGATVTINSAGLNFLLDLEYSLDNGATFQTSNTFPGILEGDYTFHVKDQFGCQVNNPVTIPAFVDGGVGQRIPYSDLPSKSLSIRYFKYIDFANSTEYKNDENTQSDELNYTQNARLYNQLFKNSDTAIRTQLKTNYETVVATVVDEQLVEHDVEVTKVVNYSNLKDRRDAEIYNLGGLGVQMGIYFLGGNTYDYFSGATTGSYVLNGSLPLWGLVGNYVFVNSAWFQISSVIFDDSVSSYVLVINTSYTGSTSTVEVSTVYNLEPYNIHEFNIDFSQFINQKVQINIAQTDTDTSFPDVVYLSEIIEVAESYSDTLCIEYYNDKNTDIFYATGIKNKINMPIEFFSGGILGETTTERTDINTFLIDAEGYENDLIAFKLMPKQMMRKAVQALSHKFVFLDGVQYVKEESPEVTPIIGTNLYRVNAEMTKSNAVYTSRGLVGDISLTPLEIPALLKTSSNGFLKIKK
jgi:hypothetical protein